MTNTVCLFVCVQDAIVDLQRNVFTIETLLKAAGLPPSLDDIPSVNYKSPNNTARFDGIVLYISLEYYNFRSDSLALDSYDTRCATTHPCVGYHSPEWFRAHNRAATTNTGTRCTGWTTRSTSRTSRTTSRTPTTRS